MYFIERRRGSFKAAKPSAKPPGPENRSTMGIGAVVADELQGGMSRAACREDHRVGMNYVGRIAKSGRDAATDP